jgi:hypothetical protein
MALNNGHCDEDQHEQEDSAEADLATKQRDLMDG